MKLTHYLLGTVLPAFLSCATAKVAQKPEAPQQGREYYQQDLEQRIHKLPPQIQQEIKDGELNVVLQELPEEKVYLNADYNSENQTITIQCNPGYTRCFNDALNHEIGHHISKGLTQEQQDNAYRVIDARLQQPDAAAFQQEIESLDNIFSELNAVYRNLVTPIAECNLFLQDKELQKLFLIHTAKYNVDSSVVQDAFEIYQDLYPSCTPENFEESTPVLEAVDKLIAEMIPRYENIYHKKNEPFSENGIDYTKDIPLHLQNRNQLRIARKQYEHEFYKAKKKLPSGGKEGEDYKKLLFSIVHRQKEGMNTNMLESQVLFTTLRSGHDSQSEEQFAAVIDSLFSNYHGPIVTAPMKLSLDEPVLTTLENIDYKGKPILKDTVQEYRAMTSSSH